MHSSDEEEDDDGELFRPKSRRSVPRVQSAFLSGSNTTVIQNRRDERVSPGDVVGLMRSICSSFASWEDLNKKVDYNSDRVEAFLRRDDEFFDRLRSRFVQSNPSDDCSSSSDGDKSDLSDEEESSQESERETKTPRDVMDVDEDSDKGFFFFFSQFDICIGDLLYFPLTRWYIPLFVDCCFFPFKI